MTKICIRFKIVAVLLLNFTASSATAFFVGETTKKTLNTAQFARIVSPIRTRSSATPKSTRSSIQKSSQLHFGLDPNHITDAISSSNSFDVHTFLATTSANTQWLADAAVATADQAADDGGWWGNFIDAFKYGITFIHNAVDGPLRSFGVENTWGISIALFTFSIRTALIPLSIEQSKSAEYIKVLKPYTKEINEKYANNEQAKTRAISRLYEDANQNPLSGCLLSLVQIPVFLGLYRGVRGLAIDGQLQEPFLWIPSLEGPVSGPDYRGLEWLTSDWTNGAPSLGWETTLAFMTMPILLVLLQSFTMQSLQPPVDESASEEERANLQKTQTVLKLLPLMIGFFSLQVPAGLTIYWFTSNIFTLTQSFAVKAYFAANPPKIELPDYWDSALSGDAENMTPEERRKASEAGISIGPSFPELIDQSKFHVYVDRTKSIRNGSYNTGKNIPSELQDWVTKYENQIMVEQR